MTEQEYARVNNRIRLTMALAALREIIHDDVGINQHELSLVRGILAKAEQDLYRAVDLEEK